MSWNHRSRRIAYLSMEIAVDPGLPTYAGGLGVLAGDMLRSCADLGEDVVGVTLLHRRGYFRQTLAPDGAQAEEPSPWRPEDHARRHSQTVTVEIAGRTVRLAVWQLMWRTRTSELGRTRQTVSRWPPRPSRRRAAAPAPR
jgi:starch phosphorylase